MKSESMNKLSEKVQQYLQPRLPLSPFQRFFQQAGKIISGENFQNVVTFIE